jgi:hypothetical protein
MPEEGDSSCTAFCTPRHGDGGQCQAADALSPLRWRAAPSLPAHRTGPPRRRVHVREPGRGEPWRGQTWQWGASRGLWAYRHSQRRVVTLRQALPAAGRCKTLKGRLCFTPRWAKGSGWVLWTRRVEPAASPRPSLVRADHQPHAPRQIAAAAPTSWGGCARTAVRGVRDAHVRRGFRPWLSRSPLGGHGRGQGTAWRRRGALIPAVGPG